MTVVCGALIVRDKVSFLQHHISSFRNFSDKPFLETPDIEPVEGTFSHSHISRCEMAGVLSGFQIRRYKSTAFVCHTKEVADKQKTRGAVPAGVERQGTEHISKMNEGRRSVQMKKVEQKMALDRSRGSSPGDTVTSMHRPFDVAPVSNTVRTLNRARLLFTFGVITDVQYADIPDGKSFLGTPRFYRHALQVLNRAVTNWNNLGTVAFAIHFGDLVDGFAKDESRAAFEKVLAAFRAFHGGCVYHMIGNHCLYNLPRAELNRCFNIPASSDEHSYYEFSPQTGFRFVVLDGYDISVLGWPEEHPNAQKAVRTLERMNPNEDKNSPIGLEGDLARFVKFNGGIGIDQLNWLENILRKAIASKENIIICCHLPLHPGTASPSCLCWNYADVLHLLQKYPCVVACMSGHAHTGGYSIDSHGIHYLVLTAALECPPGQDAFGVVDVYPDHLSLVGQGRMGSKDMYFRREASM